MLKITRKIEYALMALKYLCENKDRAISAREICDKFNTPFDTVSKSLQILNTNNVVTAIKGKNGGYKLDYDLSTLSFYRFCQLIEQKEMDSNCTLECELSESCNISTPLTSLNNYLKEFLNSLTLENLLFENTLFQINNSKKELNELQ
jgi:Rrf2 family protein